MVTKLDYSKLAGVVYENIDAHSKPDLPVVIKMLTVMIYQNFATIELLEKIELNSQPIR